MTLWLTRPFPRIDEVVAFLNEQGLSAEQFKLVSGRDPRGAQVFHVVYTDEATPHPPSRRMVEADLLPVLGQGEGGAAGEAVEQAEAIIQAHDGEDGAP